MKNYQPVQYIEQFHLLFLEQLGRKIDKSLYVLKGDCNLRFFLKSIRYSQDIDFDVHTVRAETLQNGVHKILESTPFSSVLRAKGIEILNFTEPKQTKTTQRWKLTLKVPELAFTLNTKIEFSRREMDDRTIFESIDPLIS